MRSLPCRARVSSSCLPKKHENASKATHGQTCEGESRHCLSSQKKDVILGLREVLGKGNYRVLRGRVRSEWSRSLSKVRSHEQEQ